MKALKSYINYLSRPALLHYLLPVLMIYLVAGTVAQKYIGLYEATRLFFSNIILWFGPVPLPGLPIIIGLIFLCLSLKLILKSPWKLEKAGIIITHIGVMFLLLGGLFTALFSSDGFIDLSPGQTKDMVSDYHIREFVIKDEDGKIVKTYNHSDLTKGTIIDMPDFLIKVTEVCRNCSIQKRGDTNGEYFGMALHMRLEKGKLNHNDEENMAGLTFSVEGTEQEDGHYLVLEDVPQYPEVENQDKIYQFSLQKQQRTLPFKIKLLEFKREMHPGTKMAKSYQSRVLIEDGPSHWESLIRMNEPLRYKGYTVYQGSFIRAPGGDISVLTVVWNAGRIFPYISGICICIGLLIHLYVRYRRTGLKAR